MSDTTTTRTRYTGPVNLTEGADEDEPVRSSRVDLGWYTNQLQTMTPGKQRGFTLESKAVSVAKSRFTQAASPMGIGVSFVILPYGDSRTQGKPWVLNEGESRLLVKTGTKRAARKPAEASAKPQGGGLAAHVAKAGKR